MRSLTFGRPLTFYTNNISGDSYCDVGYTSNSPHPTPEEPLGVEYPGITWAEPEEPNWVGYMVTEYNPKNSLLVYNFAVGGDTIDGVRRQIHTEFLPTLAVKPGWAPWTAEDTLFSL
jgi:hypothetical protein